MCRQEKVQSPDSGITRDFAGDGLCFQSSEFFVFFPQNQNSDLSIQCLHSQPRKNSLLHVLGHKKLIDATLNPV